MLFVCFKLHCRYSVFEARDGYEHFAVRFVKQLVIQQL